MTERSRFRWAWWLLAYASLGIGIVGIFVPGLPTTVFILIAAYAASRGSDRLHRYLLLHPRFGPAIRDWQAHGAVSRRAKWAATLAMAVSASILLTIMLSVGPPSLVDGGPAHRLHGRGGAMAMAASRTLGLTLPVHAHLAILRP